MNRVDRQLVSIEFIGIPGSGKTTLYIALSNELKKSGYEIHSFRHLYSDLGDIYPKNFRKIFIKYSAWYYFIKFFTQYPKYFVKVLKEIIKVKSSPNRVKLLLLRFFVREGASWSFYFSRKKSGFYISDEGFLHRLLSYGFSKRLTEIIAQSYINDCPLSDIVVLIEGTVDEIKKRRDFSTDPFCQIFNITNEIERTAELRSMNQNLQTVASILRKKHVNLIKLDAKITEKQFLNLFYKALRDIRKRKI